MTTGKLYFVSICTFLTTWETDSLSRWWLDIWISSSVNTSFAHFLSLLSCWSFSCLFVGVNSLFQTVILYHAWPALQLHSSSMWLEFIFLTVSFICIILLFVLFLAVLGFRCCVGFSPVAVSGLLSSCSVRVPCGGVSCWGARALGCTGVSICNGGLS